MIKFNAHAYFHLTEDQTAPQFCFQVSFKTARFWDIPRMRRWDGRRDGATLVATFEGGYFMG
jgi:hypothetical protein